MVEGVLVPKKPIVGSFPTCCARAASGHAVAPPTSLIKSRRPVRDMVALNQPTAQIYQENRRVGHWNGSELFRISPEVRFGSFATEPFNLWADRCPLLSESDQNDRRSDCPLSANQRHSHRSK